MILIVFVLIHLIFARTIVSIVPLVYCTLVDNLVYKHVRH